MQLQLGAILAFALLATPVDGGRKSASSKMPPVDIAGTYSNVRYIEEAGDLLGMEIKIIPLGEQYQAAVFVAEGSVGPMRLVDVRVRGTTLSFEVRESEDIFWSFVGTVSAQSLKGTVTHSLGGRQTVNLKRKCGYWDG